MRSRIHPAQHDRAPWKDLECGEGPLKQWVGEDLGTRWLMLQQAGVGGPLRVLVLGALGSRPWEGALWLLVGRAWELGWAEGARSEAAAMVQAMHD